MTTIKSGKFKDIGNPAREMTPEEKELLQATIDETYRQFVRDVARARNLPEDDVRRVADGRIIMGEKALELRLVDQLGNFEDAVAKAGELGKIAGEPEVIKAKKTKHSLLDLVVGSDVSETDERSQSHDSSAYVGIPAPVFRPLGKGTPDVHQLEARRTQSDGLLDATQSRHPFYILKVGKVSGAFPQDFRRVVYK